MIRTFKNGRTEHVFNGEFPKGVPSDRRSVRMMKLAAIEAKAMFEATRRNRLTLAQRRGNAGISG